MRSAPDSFSVGLVPHTLDATTLNGLQIGARVNLEVDLLARYVARLMEFGVPQASSGISRDSLERAGFIPAIPTQENK